MIIVLTYFPVWIESSFVLGMVVDGTVSPGGPDRDSCGAFIQSHKLPLLVEF